MSVYTPGTTGAGASALPNAAAAAAWHQALGRVMSGTGDSTVLICGDSIMSGLFTNIIGIGPTLQMTRMLANGLGIPVTQGLGIALPGAIAGPDNRWTLGAGWAWGATLLAQLSWGGLNTNGCSLNAPISTATASSFQPNAGTFDTFDVYYFGSITTFNVNFNGGANTGTGGGAGIQKVTVSGGSTVRPVCNFNTVGASGLGVNIIGVDPRLSTTPSLRIGNAGVTAATTSGWVIGGIGNGTSLQCVQAYNPNLVICNLGVNDTQNGIPINTSIANWTALANQAIAAQGGAGGIIFSSENPTNPNVAGSSNYANYWATLKSFCAAKNYGFIDIFSNLNGQAGFATLSAMNPSYYGDGNSIHPGTNPGTYDYGRMLAAGLLAL